MEPQGEYRDELVARERSGHTAVVEGNFLYVWGGYVVSRVSVISITFFGIRAEYLTN